VTAITAGALSWMPFSRCHGEDPDGLFFAIGHSEPPPVRDEREARAKAVCASCAVREECLAYAVATNAQHGVWGGLGEQERRLYRDNLLRRLSEGNAA